MAIFSPPDFNLTINRWIYPRLPTSGVADESVAGQMYVNSRESTPVDQPFVILRIALTGWTPPIHAGTGVGEQGDVFEIDAGSGRYYYAYSVEPMHLGFPNAYVAIWCYRVDNTGSYLYNRTFP